MEVDKKPSGEDVEHDKEMWIYRPRKGGMGVWRKWEGEAKEEEEGPRVRSEDGCAGGLSLAFFLGERAMEVREGILSFKGVGLSLNIFSSLVVWTDS